jgi:hypothetical protein
MNKIETIKYIRTDNETIDKIVVYKGESYTFFDSGLTRNVFVNEDKTRVIKFLAEGRSFDHNQEEFEIYEHASEEKRKELAKTTLDTGIIEQEFCNPVKFDDRKMTIKQMLFARSCRYEVGWNKDGNLVCFDLDEYKKY